MNEPATGRLPAVVALGIGAVGMLSALSIVAGIRVPGLPHVPLPRLGLWLVLVGILAVVLSVVGYRRGAGVLGITAGAVATGVVVAGLIPVGALAVVGAQQGTTVNPVTALIGQSNGGQRAPERSRTFAATPDGPLQLDVWPATIGSGPRPAVVWVHGGGWISGERGATPLWNEWFNDQGWTVFDVDYRTGPPPRWNQAPGDVRCAISWVKANAAELGVDPNHVVVAGESAGGHLALLAAYTSGVTQLPSTCPQTGGDATVAGAIALFPITDVTRFWAEDTRAGFARLCVTGFVGGDPTVPGSPAAAAAQVTSPVEHVRPGLPATLLLHGTSDDLVSVAHSEDLDRRLATAGVPHETVLLPFADHAYDHDWASVPSQITRSVVKRFLQDRAPS